MNSAYPTLELTFPAKGSLSQISFSQLMGDIARSRVSGSLYLLSKQTKKVVFFEAGQPVFVRSNILSECLGQILAQEGIITHEQCDQTLEAIRRTGKKQGELLVEMGILSEGNLRYGLQAQLRAKLFDVFTWDEGRYQFKGDDQPVPFSVHLSTSAAEVIFEGVRMATSTARARAALYVQRERYPMLRNRLLDMSNDLLPEEIDYVWGLDGTRRLAEVMDSPPANIDDPDVLLYALLEAGLVIVTDDAHPPQVSGAIVLPSDASVQPDDGLVPTYAPQHTITEYEDTPLPGQLPRARDLLGDDEVDFSDVEAEEDLAPGPPRHASARTIHPEISDALADAEPMLLDDAFDDDAFELIEEDNSDYTADLSELGGDNASHLGAVPITTAAPPQPKPEPRPAEADAPPVRFRPGDLEGLEIDPREAAALALPIPDDLALPDGPEARHDTSLVAPEDILLVDEDDSRAEGLEDDEGLIALDDLDDVDLDAGLAALTPRATPTMGSRGSDLGPARYEGSESTAQDRPDTEMLGAMRFGEAEAAMAQGDYNGATALLEDAYEHGFDVAELHAMLAYARFMAAGQDMRTTQHAFELLDYAEAMDPSLDLTHAYRGIILRSMGQPVRARDELNRALELNPYCELAAATLDTL